MEIIAKKVMPLLAALLLTGVLFWQFFVKGFIPIPASFMMVWYEPWKTEYAKNGVPTIPHKAVGFDVFRQHYPFKIFMMETLRNGQLPLWNPYNGSGQPMIANLQPGFFNPFSLLLFFGNKLGWAWYVILQFPFLFLSMYWYARLLRLSPFGALVTAITFSFSGVVSSRLIYGEYVYPLTALPLLFGVVECVRQHRSAVWFPFVTAFLFVSVQPQISVYILVAVLLYALVRLTRRQVMLIAGLTAVGIGIAGVQLVPTFELYRLSNVTATSSAFIFDKFLMPVSHLITIAVPNYFGNIGTYNFWGETDFTETAAALGLLPVAFALVALRRNRFFAWGIVVTILLTLDWFFPRLIYRLPIPILSTSIPTRLYLLTTFFIAVLGGIGVDKKPSKWVIIGGGIVISATALAVAFFFPCPTQIPECARVAIRNTILEIVVFSLGSLLLFMPFVKKVGLIVLLSAIGLYNAWKILPFSQPSYVAPEHPLLAQLSVTAPARVAGIGSAVLTTDFATQYKIFDTNYYNPLYTRRYGELVSYVNTGNRQKGLTRSDVNIVSDASVSAELSFRRERFWDMSGVATLAVKKDDALIVAGSPFWQDDHWMLYYRASSLPRAYLSTDVRVMPDPESELAHMFDAEIDFRNTAFVEEPISGVDIGVTSTGKAEISSYEPNSVKIQVETNAPSFLVLSDTYYPGWKAFVDDEEVNIYRTNYAFRGVVVSQGKHEVVFRYQPESLRWGINISVLSFLVWVGIWYNTKHGSVAKR